MKKTFSLLALIVLAGLALLYRYDEKVRRDEAGIYLEVQRYMEDLEFLRGLKTKSQDLESNLDELRQIMLQPDGLSAEVRDDVEQAVREAERKKPHQRTIAESGRNKGELQRSDRQIQHKSKLGSLETEKNAAIDLSRLLKPDDSLALIRHDRVFI